MMTRNKWGEEVIGTYTDPGVPITNSEVGGDFANEIAWSLLRLPEGEYERRVYGREYQIQALNRSHQGFKTMPFDAATARALRDMLNTALEA